eukprot:2197529-Amphidinium_carterae.1
MAIIGMDWMYLKSVDGAELGDSGATLRLVMIDYGTSMVRAAMSAATLGPIVYHVNGMRFLRQRPESIVTDAVVTAAPLKCVSKSGDAQTQHESACAEFGPSRGLPSCPESLCLTLLAVLRPLKRSSTLGRRSAGLVEFGIAPISLAGKASGAVAK